MSPFDDSERLDALDTLDPAVDARSLPAGLEDRVVRALGGERLLRPRTRYTQALAWAACVVLAFAAGHWLPRASSAAGAPSPTTAGTAAVPGEPRFMLLLYEDDAFEAAAEGKEADRVAEYLAWLQELTARGIPTDGEELAPRSAWLGNPVSEGDADRSPGRVAGYFVIATDDFETAQEVASTCPHLRYGGRVAVRPINEHG